MCDTEIWLLKYKLLFINRASRAHREFFKYAFNPPFSTSCTYSRGALYSDHYVPDGFEMDDAHAIPLDVLASISSLFSISTDELLGLDAPEVLSLSGLTEVQKKTLIKLRNELLSPSQKGNDLSPQQMEILHDVIKDFG